MRILMTGRGKGGSWTIRGEQLGHAIGATVDPGAADLKGADLAIVVKRPRPELLERLHKAGVPIVWDVVDAWPQPIGNEWSRAGCIDWLYQQIDVIKPKAIVASTSTMKADLRKFDGKVTVLLHHARPGQQQNPLRETVRTVGYQGGDSLGYWYGIIHRQCGKRGWSFLIDHSKTADMNLADVDIMVAFREDQGYAARNWKSGVKLANAQGAGTPSVVAREAGMVEAACGRQYFADDEAGLSAAFDELALLERRREQVARYRPFTLEQAAEQYREWLGRL